MSRLPAICVLWFGAFGLWLGASSAATPALGERPVLEPQSGHRLAVTRLAFSADGSLLASADHGGKLLVWNQALGVSRDLSPPAAGMPGYAQLYAIPGTDSLALLSHVGSALTLVDITSGKARALASTGALQRIALSPDGRRLAALGMDNRLMLFDTLSWQPIPLKGAGCTAGLAQSPGDNYGNLDFMFHPDGGHRLLIATSHGAIVLVDADQGCSFTTLVAPHDHPHLVVSLSPRGSAIAMSHQRAVTVVRAGDRAEREVMPSNDGLRRLMFTPDGKGLLAGVSDGHMQYADLDTGTLRSWTFGEGLTSLAVDATGTQVAAGLFSGSIRLVSLRSTTDKELASQVLTPVALAHDGTAGAVLVRTDTEILRIDLAGGRIEPVYRTTQAGRYAGMSLDGRSVWSPRPQGGATTLLASDGWKAREIHSTIPMANWASDLAPDGKTVAVSYGSAVRIYDSTTGAYASVATLSHPATNLSFSPDAAWLAAVGEAQAFGLVQLASGRQFPLVGAGASTTAFAFSGDSRELAYGLFDGRVRFFDLVTGAVTNARIDGEGKVTALRYSADRAQLAIGRANGVVEIVDLPSLAKRASFSSMRVPVNSLAFLPGSLVIAMGTGGEIRVSDIEQRTDLVSLFLLQGGQWLAIAPDGKFDGSERESLAAVSWRMPDDPLRPLAAEIFLRDFYEPRLVARLLACRARLKTDPNACTNAFTPARPLASLNRVQPGVRIINTQRGASAAEVLVDVEVSPSNDPSQPNGKTATGAYDLRLFRDGQLVRQLPETPVSGSDLDTWRAESLVVANVLPPVTKRISVRLPSRRKGQPVSLSAYAFNEDRVKSATARHQNYVVPQDMPVRQGVAYVVAIGVDAYAAPERTLRFAANDARAIAATAASIRNYRVVPLTLISSGGQQRDWKATKGNIRAVLDKLAGRPTAPGALADVANAGAIARATPDDLVIVSFSGHGYTSPSGKFYLLPSDSGPETAISPESLSRFISSDELSDWLRPIDAGQTALIIDACHAGAIVDQPGFKPGPMGDRGLGQLAYDKNMRILAASQADDVALESGSLLHGLLTYALAKEGLVTRPDGTLAADEDRDGAVTLLEWLRYGERLVPALYADIGAGVVSAINTKDPKVDFAFQTAAARRVQIPALFDFVRDPSNEHSVVIRSVRPR